MIPGGENLATQRNGPICLCEHGKYMHAETRDASYLSQHKECCLGAVIYHMEYKYYSYLVFQVSNHDPLKSRSVVSMNDHSLPQELIARQASGNKQRCSQPL